MKFYMITVLGALLIGCQPKLKESESTSEPTAVAVEETKSADINDISLEDLEGNPIKLSDYRGSAVFLNFWSTWCKPCIKEMPSIERAIEKLEGEKIVFLAASDESVEKITKFMAKYKFELDFIRLLDDYEALGVSSLPTTIIYDKEGQIVLNEAGAREWDADDMIEMMSSL